MTTRTHLARLERSLSPRQAVNHWYAPLLQAGSHTEFAEMVWEADQREDIGIRLRRVKTATRQALAGRPRDEVEQAARDAATEYFFLHNLVGRINQQACTRWETHVLRSLLLLTQSTHLPLVFLHARGPDGTWSDKQLNWSEREWGHCRDLVTQSRLDFESLDRAHRWISEHYLGGAPVLFAGAREQISFGLRCVHELEENCRLFHPEEPPEVLDSDAGAQALVRWWIDMARVDLYEVQDRQADAHRILQRYARQSSSRTQYG